MRRVSLAFVCLLAGLPAGAAAASPTGDRIKVLGETARDCSIAIVGAGHARGNVAVAGLGRAEGVDASLVGLGCPTPQDTGAAYAIIRSCGQRTDSEEIVHALDGIDIGPARGLP